ncbi:hypothetical protein AMTR_s00053p00131840 [Amborella trichopoda]|uniref:Uncharacterized protein n=1 Tax=Amborella trichopoda TaxID=13333 RepID=W1P5A3_AMBTC|nr:hypothetical protein AMTR_s00053p00131840 [Amborella trichopoda]
MRGHRKFRKGVANFQSLKIRKRWIPMGHFAEVPTSTPSVVRNGVMGVISQNGNAGSPVLDAQNVGGNHYEGGISLHEVFSA